VQRIVVPQLRSESVWSRQRCDGGHLLISCPAISPSISGNPAVTFAVSLATEALRLAAGGQKRRTAPAANREQRRSSPQQHRGGGVSAVLRALRRDYAASYFVTGDVSLEVYEEDATFADPTISFRGVGRLRGWRGGAAPRAGCGGVLSLRLVLGLRAVLARARLLHQRVRSAHAVLCVPPPSPPPPGPRSLPPATERPPYAVCGAPQAETCTSATCGS
jgi:hypothetical protein